MFAERMPTERRSTNAKYKYFTKCRTVSHTEQIMKARILVFHTTVLVVFVINYYEGLFYHSTVSLVVQLTLLQIIRCTFHIIHHSSFLSLEVSPSPSTLAFN